MGERIAEIRAYRLFGAITHDRGDAEDWYRRASTLADAIGAKTELAHCHAGLAKLFRRGGKHQQANEHFMTATTMYRDMGMTYWLEKAKAEMQEMR